MMVNMGDVWDRATGFISDNLSVVLPIALFAIFLPSSLSASIAPIAKQSPTANTVVGIVGLVLTLITLWGQLAIIALATEPRAGRQPAVAAANARILPLIGLALITLIGFFALILPFPIVLGLAGYDLQAAMNGEQVPLPDGTGGFVALYALFLLPLLIFLGARLALLTPVVVRERRGLGAFKRSFVLTRGIAWKVIGVMILYCIVFGVALLAARTVFGSILELVAGGEGTISVATVLTSVLVSAVQTAFIALSAAFLAKLYLAVRDAREAIVESR
ncbi:hypothetical protein [Sphingomonas hylomeconis]|uniref:Glycerophosphoryl diester phosphodiesterase membrane domain-containing protein n=1 Tax=Sphingomonas hylomeconis TaxID=1395958 RepID=A0ABV7T371_9SPHN|nr:hypothetical protein [Sphingomonas hylomeconis]